MPNIAIDPAMMKRARINGLNVSAVTRRALREACEKLERIESGTPALKP